MPHLWCTGLEVHQSLLNPLLIPIDDFFPEKPAFQRVLLRWYSTHQRDLPWRKDRNPYRILVSEFMLQQTRVEAVVPYFERFLRLFPTLKDLSRAPRQKVLKAWEGMGYYARARNLHAAAKIICRDLHNRIPSVKEELLKLPGLGSYTAGAVSSLAFNQRVAAVDGNVRRVLNRLFPQWSDSPKSPGKKEIDRFMEHLIPAGRVSEFNQAMMDLGAMVCIPLRPRCSLCPVQKFCASRGGVGEEKKPVKKLREETWAIALVEKEGLFFLQRNQEKGLLAGLWQFPRVVLKNNYEMSGEPGAKAALKKYLWGNFGLRIKIEAPLAEEEYFFTHIHATMKPYLCRSMERQLGSFAAKNVRWVGPSHFHRYPISTAMKKIAALIKN